MSRSAKTWGDSTNPHVLTIHGIQDNAGVFDLLIPLLPTHFYYICIDLPGHGKSTHFPKSLFIHTIDYFLVYKFIVDHFKRDKYIIMGHSYGGGTAVRFIQIYPSYADKIILIDTLHTIDLRVSWYQDYMSQRIDNCLRYNDVIVTGKQSTYSYDEAVDKIIANRMGDNTTRRHVKLLLDRSLIPTGDGRYRFSLDPRVKNFIDPINDSKFAIELLQEYPNSCPVLVVLAKQNLLHLELMNEFVKHYKKQKNYLIKYVDDSHDVLLVRPELISPYICKFLNNATKSKL